MRILHLSDLHLAPGRLHNGQVDTAAELETLLAAVPSDFAPDVVVVTGDISDDDSTASYDLARELIGAYAAGAGIDVAWVPGNHDNGPHFDRLHQPDGPVRHVARGHLDVGDGRIAIVDSRVRGCSYGQLGTSFQQGLEALAGFTDAVVAMHHPPLPVPSALHQALRLRDAESWTDRLIDHPDFVTLTGHYHRPATGKWAGGRVVVGAAVANQTRVDLPWPLEGAIARHGITLVDTRSEALATVLQTGDGREVLAMDAARVIQVATMFGDPDQTNGGVDLDPEGPAARAAGWWHEPRIEIREV